MPHPLEQAKENAAIFQEAYSNCLVELRYRYEEIASLKSQLAATILRLELALEACQALLTECTMSSYEKTIRQMMTEDGVEFPEARSKRLATEALSMTQETAIQIIGDRNRQQLEEVERLTSSANVLAELAKQSPPPQKWWDEDFEGF
jgi:protein-tyrosine-phosphatase